MTSDDVKPGFFLSKLEKPVSLFLFFWWALGTSIITFKGPFLTAFNGYFTAWIGLFSTAHCVWAGGTFFRCLRKVPPAHSRSTCLLQELGW
jgi:hypothetical protein